MARSNDPNVLTVNRKYWLINKLVNLNAGPDDVASFVGLPAKYLIKSLVIYDASLSLAASAATLGLFTDQGGSGTALVSLATLTALSAASKYTAMTLAGTLGTDYRTEVALFLRNGIRHGTAATVSARLEIEDLTG